MTTRQTRRASFHASVAVGALLLTGFAGMVMVDDKAEPARAAPAVVASIAGGPSPAARSDAATGMVVEQADLELVGASIGAYDR
jgi:hypothetical protein